MEQRETFRSEHADYIPADLWAGLLNPPPTYRFVIEDEEIAALPDISREVYEAALKRAKARIKPSVRPDS
jgi:autophagy-related protein 17